MMKGMSARHPLSCFVSTEILLFYFFLVESFCLLRDVAKVVFDGEVPGFEAMEFGIRNVLEKSLAAFLCKEDVGLSPKDEGRGFLLAEKFLPDRIKLNVLPVIVEQVEIDADGIRPFHIMSVHLP